jgi:hypothetical protein
MFLPLEHNQVNQQHFFHSFSVLLIDPVQPNRPQKPKIDISQYFNDIGVLNKDSKPQPAPSVPNTIGAARKASLAKDVDPTVLKVKTKSLNLNIIILNQIGS